MASALENVLRPERSHQRVAIRVARLHKTQIVNAKQNETLQALDAIVEEHMSKQGSHPRKVRDIRSPLECLDN